MSEMLRQSSSVLLLCRMDQDVRDSMEAIANLIYLLRRSLHDPAATIANVDLADERMKAIALHFALDALSNLRQGFHVSIA